MHNEAKQLDGVLDILKTFPKVWNAKSAILELKEADYNWRQMEWIGFYFQYLCKSKLGGLMQIPWEEKKIGAAGGTVEFDGFMEVPWDFKAHPLHNAKGEESHDVAGNDSAATAGAIVKYGWVGLILALGDATFNDEDRSFQKWHTKLKGGESSYEVDRVARGAPSRLRKTAFALSEIQLIKITDKTLSRFGTFQEGFRNSNGRPRKPKVLIDTCELDQDILGRVRF